MYMATSVSLPRRSLPYRAVGLDLNADRDNWAFGDPILGATFGRHEGNLNHTIGMLVNVPIGQ
jgi:hypothetical protein